jgi:branched-chain amino acid transport system permease protein
MSVRAHGTTAARLVGGAVAAVAAFYLPVLAGGSAVAYSTCATIAIFAVMAYGTDLVLSYLGEVSLGHTIFWAGGGYVTALIATRLGWNAWLTALASVGFAVLLAFALGLATLRTREFVFSLVTYAAAVVAMEIAFNWAFVGGSDGITGIPRLVLPLGIATYAGGTSAELWPIAFGLLLATIGFIDRFRRSRLGLAALMVQMNPSLAMTLGLDTRRVRLMVFVVSAPVSALAGWLYAYQRAYVGPDMFESYFLVVMLTAAVLAGRRVLLGPVIGTAVILTQQNLLSVGGDGDKIILGAVLAAVLIFWPQGLIGLWHLARAAVMERARARARVEHA